jgi:nicotinate-nucleotide--dimethylbenzimidazole phosphoribosyltransferase
MSCPGAGADVYVVDIGMKEELYNAPGLINRTLKDYYSEHGKRAAMTMDEAEKAINAGIELALAHRKGV